MGKSVRACLFFGLLAVGIFFATACGSVYIQNVLTAAPKEIQAAFSKIDKAKFSSTLKDYDIGIITKEEWQSRNGAYRKVKFTVALEDGTERILGVSTLTDGSRVEMWITEHLSPGDLIAFKDAEKKFTKTNPRPSNKVQVDFETVRLLVGHRDLGLTSLELKNGR